MKKVLNARKRIELVKANGNTEQVAAGILRNVPKSPPRASG